MRVTIVITKCCDVRVSAVITKCCDVRVTIVITKCCDVRVSAVTDLGVIPPQIHDLLDTQQLGDVEHQRDKCHDQSHKIQHLYK